MATTVTANSSDRDEVNFAINGGGTNNATGLPFQKLQHGDTCNIPAGNLGAGHWASVITVDKNISIIGAGIGQTVITGGLLFIIKPTSRIAAVGTPDSHRIKISGMTWTRSSQAYTFRIAGACPIDEANITNPALSGGFEIDHILINATTVANMAGFVFDCYGWPEGVVHHVIYDLDPDAGGQHFVTNHCWAPDGTGGFGDYSWSNPSGVGTIHQLYIEDCIVKRSGSFECNINSGGNSGGARYVCRHITCWGSAGGGHETRSDGGVRCAGGLRSVESYKNLFVVPGTAKNQSQTTAVRSGEAVHWGNRHNRFGGTAGPALNQHGLFAYPNGAWNAGPYPAGTDTGPNNPAPGGISTYGANTSNSGTSFGGPDGANPWDLNANGNLTDINFTGNNFTALSTQNVADTISATIPTPNLSSIYASGDGTAGKRLYRDDTAPATGTNIHLVHIDATLPGGGPDVTDRWYGFTIRNLDAPTRDCLAPVSFGVIDAYNPTAKTFTIRQNNEPNDAHPTGRNSMQFKIAAGQRWEIRRVLQCFSTTGCGSMTTGHPDNSTQGGFMETDAVRLTDGTRTWANCDAPGCSMWDNAYRLADNVGFTSIPKWAGLDRYLGSLVNPRNTANHPGYSYDPNVAAGPANPGTRIGANDEAWQLVTANANSSFSGIAGTQNGTPTGGPVLYTDGDGGYIYPHPFIDAGPRFTDTACTFSTNGGSQTFTVHTAGFTGTVTITRTGTLPANISFASTPAVNATAAFSGTAATATAGTYTQHLTATSSADGSILQDFVITILNPDNPPTCSMSVSPAAPYTAPVTLVLTATATDDKGVASVGFYQGSTLINSLVTTQPYTTDWTGVGQGTYSLTAKATDTIGQVTQSSPAISITVNPAPAGLQAPTIIVSA